MAATNGSPAPAAAPAATPAPAAPTFTAAQLAPTTTANPYQGRAQTVPLPERFQPKPDVDEAPPPAEGTEPTEPTGEVTAIVPEAEGTGDPAATQQLSAEEYADLIATPGMRQRIAEAPASQRGAILDAAFAKQEARAQSVAQAAAADARQRGIEEGRNALARELVVQNIDSMEPFERASFFQDPKNAGAEQLWHESKVQARTPSQAQPATAFVQQIVDQGNVQLARLTGHTEYQPIYDEMVKGVYAADPAGLAALAARVERALAVNKAAREDADAVAANRAAAVLKSGPRTTRLGAGGAAPGAVITADMIKAGTLTTADYSRLMATDEGEAAVMEALRGVRA